MMATDESSFGSAYIDPACAFESPKAIVDDRRLSFNQKTTLLERWESLVHDTDATRLAQVLAAKRELVVQQPAHEVYESPEEVLTDPRLSDEQRSAILERWEADAREIAVATEEGMSGGEPSRIEEVMRAKAKLRARRS